MPQRKIHYQKRIYREDLRGNPEAVYVFGDNSVRKGLGGQAGEMRGEPNAYGVATKVWPGMDESAFFSDADVEHRKIIRRDLMLVAEAADNIGNDVGSGPRLIVLPLDGLGTGLSELPTRAPKTFAFLAECLSALESGRKFPDAI